jgi:hypothetical protein
MVFSGKRNQFTAEKTIATKKKKHDFPQSQSPSNNFLKSKATG